MKVQQIIENITWLTGIKKFSVVSRLLRYIDDKNNVVLWILHG